MAIACASNVVSVPSIDGAAGVAGADQESVSDAGSGSGSAGAVDNGIGGATATTAAGGAPAMAGAAAAAGAGAEGGAPPMPESEAVAKRAASGKQLCEADQDCDGLLCTSSTSQIDRACLARCDSDADCKHDERCFGQESIAKSCFRSCQNSVTECAYQFDCADYYRIDQYLCLPRNWVRNWPAQPDPNG